MTEEPGPRATTEVKPFQGDVDFSAEEWRGVLEPLGDSKYFERVRVDPESGTVTWPSGEDLAPEPLYEQTRAHPLVAV
ncbi:MAG: DUF2442 domain-containing protein [Acidimicrobiales bacterium]